MKKFYIPIIICLLIATVQFNGFVMYAATFNLDSTQSKVSLRKERIKTTGEFKGLVILVEFIDTSFTLPNASQRFDEMLNSSHYNYQEARGSARDYFISNSDSTFFPSFNVIGPVKLPKKMSYYGENGENGEDIHAGEMVMDACRLASSYIKFSDYDTNDDGLVDMVYIFFASYSENENPSVKEYIWSHAGNIADYCLILDGKRIGRYACSSEYIGKANAENAQMATIGTFCHEFSHILGLPDFYNTLSNSGLTLGSMSLMDKGNYLDNGRCPAGYSAFEKEYVNWTTVPVQEEISNKIQILLSPVNSDIKCNVPNSIKICIDKDEYYYLENRQNENWDKYLPGQGLFIYHIDLSDSLAWDRNEVNIHYTHPNYELIRSNGKFEIDYKKIAFPGDAGISDFHPTKSWKGKDIKFKIENIKQVGRYILFDLVGLQNQDSPH